MDSPGGGCHSYTRPPIGYPCPRSSNTDNFSINPARQINQMRIVKEKAKLIPGSIREPQCHYSS